MTNVTFVLKHGVSFEEASTSTPELWAHFGSEESVLDALTLLVELARRKAAG